MASIVDNILDKYNVGKLKDDEYIDPKDGLIKCKKCHTDRVVKLPSGRIVRCLCKCEEEEDNKKEEARKGRERMRDIEELQKSSLIGERYKGVTFENTELVDNKQFLIAFNRCKKYCEIANEVLEKGQGIYLFGDKGTGKTHLTCCMANYLMHHNKQVLLTNFFEISKHIQSTFNNSVKESEEDFIKKIANIDFLFIDDLGTERVQSSNGSDMWLQEKIFDILNKRYNAKKPTIFSSNYSIKELGLERGIMPKTLDRIVEMSTAIIEIRGASFRIGNRKKQEVNF